MTFKPSSKPSYSKLLGDIKDGRVESLLLVPARREVQVRYQDGTIELVPVLPNDQYILRAAEASSTPLSVKDIRAEQSLASLSANLALILLFLVALAAVVRKSASIANKTIARPASNEEPTFNC